MNQIELEALMMAVVDGVASPSQREVLHRYLRDHPELARELEEHMAIKALTDGWVKRLDVDLIEDQHRESPVTQAAVGVGGALFAAGLAVITGYTAAEVLLASDAPLWIRVGTGLMAAGGSLALLSVLHWKWKTWRRDPYTEVIR